ncbi:uncharacterized protein LOC131942991 [Physella acuta]|uniref:uncharacterized protein LOC131942991 n=1 Tax=Physella acuta TaxID=109671 RepID=UPI0027DD4761|nr:uncharacterized protein LOC131942991 [Physella acuta]
MYISPGKKLPMMKVGGKLQGWLFIYNPSKNIVGFKISPPHIVTGDVSFLEPSKCRAFRLSVDPTEDKELYFVHIHWFLLESNREYTDEDILPLYNSTTSESLLKHRLAVSVTDVQSSELLPLKLATVEPDSSHGYLAEVFKNGISVQKYWLKRGNYVCHLLPTSNVLVRYPKYPTLGQPNGFQRGMRIVIDLPEKDLYAEAIIEEATEDGFLTLEYSRETTNEHMKAKITDPVISIKEIEYEIIEKQKNEVEPQDGKKSEDQKPEVVKVAALNLISYEPRGHVSVTKRAYVFPPFHLLTEASQAAIESIDNVWRANTLNSVAQCRSVPTRVTVQELQLSELIGSDTEWLVGANSSRKFDMAFAFLPSNLGHKTLCYPSVPRMFTNIDVHVLCFLVDQMYFNIQLGNDHEISLDVPLHFVNVNPITPSPPLQAEDMYTSAFNGWIYSTLYSNKMCLPHCDKLFPEGRPDFNKTQLEALMRSLIHVYAAQCHLLAEQYGGIKYQTTPENGTKVITDSIQHNYMSIIQQTDQAELADDTLIKKGFRNNVYCKAHQWCLPGTNVQLEGEFDFRKELFSPYEETVNVIWREGLKIPKLPQHLYALLTNLQYLKLEGCDGLKELPDGISKCERLEMISLRNCVIEILPSDLFHIPYLHRFHCHSLKVKTMPTSIPVNCPITHLILSDLLLTSIPKEFGLLTDLELLNLNSNPIETLPMELSSLTKLKTLLLCGVPWIVTGGSKVEMPIDQYQDFLAHNSSLDYYLGREKLMAMFNEADHNKNARLDETEIAALNAIFFWKVPRLGSSCINCSEYGGIPPVIFLLSGLETLHLDFQAITIVPVHMCRLQNLKALSISHNPLLESLPGSLGHLPSLKSLRLVSNPSLRTPPHEVVSRGFQSIKAYLKRLAGGFTECRRTKLMLVGLGGAGKTSLLQALMSDAKKTAGTRGQDITNGIDILPWTVKDTNGVDVTYSTWDFAGQTLYYNTHQFFLSKRAVYLLLWSTRQGFEHAGLEFWLSSIASHAPKTPIFVVGTHCDQVPKADIPIADLKQRYPQIAGFHFVSSLQGTGIIELEKDLLKVTLEQKNMGEKIPQVWLKLEEQILKARKAKSILEWTKIKQFCMEVGIYDEKDIREAIQFLHELGTVQYFDNEFLRDQVVINPQWIVNVMSCVVSVKNSPIQDSKGRFHHKFIKEIWKEYPESLHQWLLRLTEEFDLTFPLPEEATNIVPCLLPQEVPDNLNWPLPDVSKHQKETKLIYQFSYLPAGLFNRAQVRLFQLSDGNLIWKRGSLLKKNKHKALISQTSDSELQVKVQGPRPENVIFLIHEIFESLIQESFHGVIYEFLIPCPDCIIREGTLDPSMFESSLVKRARDHRAPFLQCRKYFHTISMAQLFEVMPSDSDSDFDAHLQNSLTIMQQLNSALSTDVAIIYSSKDKVDDKHPTLLNPERVWRDLEAAGITCWYSDDMDSISVQDLMLALKNCKVVVALVSDNFERDEKSHGLLMYTMDTLAKNFTIVVIGESQEWLNTDLGMRIGKQEEMVMVKTKNRYDESRIQQMVKAVSVKLQQNQQSLQKHPSVFISYCWSNSREAQKLGTICSDKSLGWGDPREVKKELEKKNITCWLDIDQPFAGKGLFKNITEGIRNSKVLVAFVSDEYVSSDNCMMELRFGVLNLQLPTIIVVVGTGKDWKQSEVGILMQRSKAAKVYMQQENPTALDTLVHYIKERMPSHSDQILAQKEIQTKMKNVQEQEKTKVENKKAIDNTSIQEEYELVQRKFMRHIISYVSSMDTVPTPRLIVVDFEKIARSVVKKDGHHDTESILERPGSAGRPRLRPKTASRSSKLMTVVAEDEADQWENETFCLKLLCEDEKGWHICKMSFPVKMNEELKSTLKGCSAYLGRMYAILRQSAVSLNCFDGPIGSQYISWIEQCAVENVNFLDSYIKLRTSLVEDDTAQEFLSQLKRCHLPTGKIYWLCEQHASGPRITRLSTETTSRNEVGRVIYEEDVKLRDNLERSDIYKQRKKAKSPAANIVLPALDVKNKEQISEYDQAQKTKPAHETKRQESVRNLATLLTSPSDRSSSSTSVKSSADSGAATDRSSSSAA